MHRTAFVLVCLACVGLARRVQNSKRGAPRDWEQDLANEQLAGKLSDADLGAEYMKAAMKDPAMMEEVAQMMRDPAFMAEVQKMTADPSFAEQAKRAREQMRADGVDVDPLLQEEMVKAMSEMSEADLAMMHLRQAMGDPSIMKNLTKMMSDPETAAKIEEYMADPAFQEQVESVREQARKMARDPENVAQMRQMMEDPDIQLNMAARDWELENMKQQQAGKMNLAEVGMANLQGAMADPTVMEEMQKMMEDPEMQKQLQALMEDPEYQKQVQDMLSDPEVQAQLQEMFGGEQSVKA